MSRPCVRDRECRPDFESLEPRLLLDAVADLYEPDDLAVAASLITTDGTPQTHSIHTVDDEDWVYFQITSASSVTIETDGPSGDTVIWLCGPDDPDNFLDYDDEGGNGSFSMIDGIGLTPGTYWVCVASYGGYDTIETYTLSVTATALVPDAYEPDDTAAGASLIPIDGTPQTHSIHVINDVDWVRFNITTAATVSVVTAGTSGSTTLYLYGPNSSTNLIAYDDGGWYDDFARIEGEYLTPGVYYARVSEYSGWDTIDTYQISVVGAPATADAYEPDNTAATAKPITTDGTPQTHSIHASSDVDWVTFTLASTSEVTIETDGLVGETAMWLYGPNSSTTLVDYDDGGWYGGFADIVRGPDNPLGPGVYYVKVAEYGQNATINSYTISVSGTGATPGAPFVEIVTPIYGRYVADTIALSWVDYDEGYNAQISFYIDSDSDPLNGTGEVLLGTWNEDPEGTGDEAVVAMPGGVTPRFAYYYIWARMTDAEGDTYSTPVPIRVFERVGVANDPVGDACGGSSYEIFGIEAGQLGSLIYYRVRTNYCPDSSGGGDLYINVGGTYQENNGVVSGVAVNSHSAQYPQQVVTPNLYGNATFTGGSCYEIMPCHILTFVTQTVGQSTAVVTTTVGLPWEYELEGYFNTLYLPGYSSDLPIQLAWTMICGNDVAEVIFPNQGYVPGAEDFVYGLYAGLLRRNPTAGWEYWINQVKAGTPRATVTEAFLTCAEFEVYVAPVVRLYRAFMNRWPDGAGLSYWVGQLRAGVPLEAIAKAFANSAEFKARNGDLYNWADNATFVRWLYNHVLGRTPRETAAANDVWFWVRPLLMGLPREYVMVAFTQSLEYNYKTYHALHCSTLGLGLLGRTMTDAEIDAWKGYILSGHTYRELSGGVLGSGDYQVVACLSTLSLSSPIVRLYQAYLGHAPSTAALNYWTSIYRSGVPLSTVALIIANSTEFDNYWWTNSYRDGTNQEFVVWLYETVLNRTPAQAHVDYWLAQLAYGRSTRAQLMAVFTESAENVYLTRSRDGVGLVFNTLLRRAPTSGAEDDYWMNYLDAGNSLKSMLEFFLEA